MRRRNFITVAVGAVLAAPLTARAQHSREMPTIGFLGVDPSSNEAWAGAFEEHLRALGWVDGQNVSIVYQWTRGQVPLVEKIASDFVRQKVNVIVTFGDAVPELERATSSVPIVFAIAKDPLGNGFVKSLAHPGGNVTGLSTQANDTTSKRLELFRDAAPNLRRLAIMGNVGFSDSAREMREVETVAEKSGLHVLSLEIRSGTDIAPFFAKIAGSADGVYVVTDALVADNRVPIIASALRERLPTVFNTRIYVESGGLMSYGADFGDLFRHAADYVDKILNGAKPGDLPVQQPTKFDLIINLKTAKAIGLIVSPDLLAIADEVIE